MAKLVYALDLGSSGATRESSSLSFRTSRSFDGVVMTMDDFNYSLPESLIARYPLAERTDSRLMVVHRETGLIEHRNFTDLKSYLAPRDILVFNNSKVMQARLYGQKSTGGRVEFLIERVLNKQEFLSHIRTSKRLKPGQVITLEPLASRDTTDTIHVPACQIIIVNKISSFYHCQIFSHTTGEAPKRSIWEMMTQYGHIPLPPYFHRPEELSDNTRYQTVYADPLGSAAAPTAGLHFSAEFLEDLKQSGVAQAFVTLHVGAGTFQPVRAPTLEAHVMHQEWLSVPQETVTQIHQAKQSGGRLIAVGTTSVRALETAAQEGAGRLVPYKGESQLFLYPGKNFYAIDGLLTNFHLPQSTLLMLVSALAGTELIQKAYQLAIQEKYRFFSYGDAMLIC